jgi:hypothetical protein
MISANGKTTWYLAGLIQDLRVASDALGLVNVNWILINTSDAEEAYTKALEFGSNLNYDDRNADGEIVESRFKGLKDLLHIYDPLEDGCEIFFDEYDNKSIGDVERMAASKEPLTVFDSSRRR